MKDNKSLHEFLADEEVKEMNDFAGNDEKKLGIKGAIAVIAMAVLVVAMLILMIKLDGNREPAAGSNDEVIDKMYEIEEESMENAELIADDMIGELTAIKEYLTGIEETVNSNEETLLSYPDSNSYSELSVTFKDSTKKISNDFSQVSGEISKTKESIDSLIKKLESKDGNSKEITKEYELIKESIKTIDNDFSSSYKEVEKLLEELKKNQDAGNDELIMTMEGIKSELNRSSSEDFKKLNEGIEKIESSYSALSAYLEGVLTKQISDLNGNVNDELTKVNENIGTGNDEIKNTINERFDSLSLSFSSTDEGIKETLNEISEKLEQVFCLVSDAKAMIASTIADKGIGTDRDATFKVLSESIALIGADVINVSSENILQGTTVYDGLDNCYIEGSMVNRGSQSDFSPTEGTSVTYEPGYYPSAWTVDTTGAYEKGYSDGKSDVPNAKVSYNYHVHTLSDGTVKEAGFESDTCDGCFNKPVYHKHSGDSVNGGGCYTTPVYHVHTGSSEKGGGCYTVAHTGTRTAKCYGGVYCSQGPYPADTSGQEYYVGTCNVCGAHLSCYNSPGYVSCDATRTETYTYYTVGCGKNGSTIEGYKPGCGKDGEVDHFECGCGKEDYATAGEGATIASATISYE